MTQQIPKQIVEDGRVPIIVGITGHRYITSRSEPLIERVFIELHDKYPNTPIVVLSPLADGADRLVAKVALDLKKDNDWPISLICPLPMSRLEYEKDFDEDSKLEFAELLEESAATFKLPLEIGSTPLNIGPYGPLRDTQYLKVGQYIARHSHILIALWDGVDTGKTGGTSDIVKERHEGRIKTAQNPLDETDSGPIYYFPVKKMKNGEVRIEARREIFPGIALDASDMRAAEFRKKKAEGFHRVLSRIEAFNLDARTMKNYWKKKINKNRGYVIPDYKRSDLTDLTRRLLNHYAVADTLAMCYQRLFTRTLQSLFILALIALLFFEIYAHVVKLPWILLGYPVVLGIGWGLFRIAKKKFFQSKYLDYRALAEGLRVQFFWILSGRDAEVEDYYLPKQKSELDWIKYAVQSLNMPFSRSEFEEKNDIEKASSQVILERLRSLVLKHWVDDQARYFARTAPKQQNQLKKYHSWGKGIILSGIVLSGVLFIMELACLYCGCRLACHEGDFLEHFRDYSIVFIAMAIAIAAAIGGYVEKEALSAQAKRYAWMSDIFNRAETELKRLLEVENVKGAQDLVFDLGKAALEENGDWLIIRRERELEVPTG